MSSRYDIASTITHFTKGMTWQDAYLNFKNIIKEGRIRCGTGMIKGGDQNCSVCFTETPIDFIGTSGFQNHINTVKYSPFGFMFEKSFIYSLGGRPVIYQSDEEYEYLHQLHRYRHVRYEPHNNIDFTWEREWRANTPFVPVSPQHVILVMPNVEWKDYLLNEFNQLELSKYHYYERHREYVTVMQGYDPLDYYMDYYAGPKYEMQDFPYRVILIDPVQTIK